MKLNNQPLEIAMGLCAEAKFAHLFTPHDYMDREFDWERDFPHITRMLVIGAYGRMKNYKEWR